MATKSIILGRWNAPGMRLPAGESARLETITISGGDRQVVSFDDTTDESCILTDAEWPENFRGDGTLRIDLFGIMASATAGEIRLNIEVEAVTPGDSHDLDSALSFDTANTVTSPTVPAVAGHLFKTTITLTNADSVAVGDYVRVKITRDADHAEDTATGDFRLLGAHVREEVTYFRAAGLEFVDDDSDYVRLKAPANVTTAYTLTWPAAAPGSNGYAIIVSTAGVLTFEAITATAAGSNQGEIQRRSGSSTLEADANFSFTVASEVAVLTLKDGGSDSFVTTYNASGAAPSTDHFVKYELNGTEVFRFYQTVFQPAEGLNLTFGTTTGTKFGTSTSQKQALWNATPIIQPSGSDQAEPAAQTQDTLTDSSGGTADTTIAAITDASTAGSADVGPVKDALADIAAQLAKIKADMAALRTFVVAHRTATVNYGMMKGSA